MCIISPCSCDWGISSFSVSLSPGTRPQIWAGSLKCPWVKELIVRRIHLQLSFTAVCTREVTDRAGQPFILSPFSHCLRCRSGPWRKDGEKEEGQGKKTNRRLHLFVPQEESWSLHSFTLSMARPHGQGRIPAIGRALPLKKDSFEWAKEILAERISVLDAGDYTVVSRWFWNFCLFWYLECCGVGKMETTWLKWVFRYELQPFWTSSVK